MSRDGLQSDEQRPGFPVYRDKDLDKVNAMRVAKSQPDFHGVPIIHDGDVTYTKASVLDNKPASCYNCALMNSKDSSCMLMSPSVKVVKCEIEGIEYWPKCAEFVCGSVNEKEPIRLTAQAPGQLGLAWINAPKPGQACGGCNCGGTNGGDDCDNYMVERGLKWENPTGNCRVLRHTVDAGDYCSAWWDDDILQWEEAQNAIKNNGEHGKRELARSIVRRD